MASQAGVSIDALNDDIQRLIPALVAKAPHDPSVNTRLKALGDLQTILQTTQNLPQDQVVLIKNKIDELAVTIRPPSAAPIPTPTPPQTQHVAPPGPAPAATPQVSLDSLLGQGALAALMARNSATPQPPTPQPPAVAPPPLRPAAQASAAPAAGSDPLALMQALRKAGILSGSLPASSTAPAAPAAPPAIASLAGLPFSLPMLGQPPPVPSAGPLNLENMSRSIELNASSLKQ
jgi:pre-mRNA cleavage complex 2 protein Pcf11